MEEQSVLASILQGIVKEDPIIVIAFLLRQFTPLKLLMTFLKVHKTAARTVNARRVKDPRRLHRDLL